MYYEKFFPFYAAYTSPLLYEGERIQENEFSRLKSYYPETAGKIQNEVEQECDFLDYEGSWIYDEYPDRLMLRRAFEQLKEKVKPELQAVDISGGFFDELVEVLFYQELLRRRCRRHRCRRYFL